MSRAQDASAGLEVLGLVDRAAGPYRPDWRDAYVNDTQVGHLTADEVAQSAQTVRIPSFANYTQVLPVSTYCTSECDEYGASQPDHVAELEPEYKPLDLRPEREQIAGRKNYKKAVKHYGKTYVFTRGQVLMAMAVMLGFTLIIGTLLFSYYVHLAQGLGLI